MIHVTLRPTRRVLYGCAALVVATFLASLQIPAAGQDIEWFDWPDPVGFQTPVQAQVVDGYRPPLANWLPGNRGLEYETEPGTVVVAPISGSVTFAGQVGGSLHVTIRFSDQRRTTLSFLESIEVRRGDQVTQGQVVGRAGPGLHLTVRRNDGSYLDPTLSFREPVVTVRLVPLDR